MDGLRIGALAPPRSLFLRQVMIHSATDDLAVARKMADTLKREVNKHYKCMEIDIDGVMKSMLLLKKKKYAALMIEEKNGETVRRPAFAHAHGCR